MKRIILTELFEKSQANDEDNEFIFKVFGEGEYKFLDLFNGEKYYVSMKSPEYGSKFQNTFLFEYREDSLYVDKKSISEILQQDPSEFTLEDNLKIGITLNLVMALLKNKERREGNTLKHTSSEQNIPGATVRDRIYKESSKIYIKDYVYDYSSNPEARRSYNKIAEEWMVRGYFRIKNGIREFVKGYKKSFRHE